MENYLIEDALQQSFINNVSTGFISSNDSFTHSFMRFRLFCANYSRILSINICEKWIQFDVITKSWRTAEVNSAEQRTTNIDELDELHTNEISNTTPFNNIEPVSASWVYRCVCIWFLHQINFSFFQQQSSIHLNNVKMHGNTRMCEEFPFHPSNLSQFAFSGSI